MITGKNGNYDVWDVVAENAVYRVRRCTDSHSRELLFQIVIDANQNNKLALNALALSRLKAASNEIEKEYAESGSEGSLNYDLGFPELYDSFILTAQGSRQANVLGFRGVETVGSIIPLVRIIKSPARIDLRTSAWIMGKLLKIIAFAHGHRFEIGKISGNNVLIEPDKHYVVIFDWSGSTLHEHSVPPSVRRNEIKLAAQSVIKVLGGDLDSVCENDADLPYTRYLQSLATSGESDADRAHKTFYGIVDSLCEDPLSVWERGFYEFTTVMQRT